MLPSIRNADGSVTVLVPPFDVAAVVLAYTPSGLKLTPAGFPNPKSSYSLQFPPTTLVLPFMIPCSK